MLSTSNLRPALVPPLPLVQSYCGVGEENTGEMYQGGAKKLSRHDYTRNHLAQNSISAWTPQRKEETPHQSLVIQSELRRSHLAPQAGHTPQIPSCATKACQVASISAGVGTTSACTCTCGCGSGCGAPPVISKKF